MVPPAHFLPLENTTMRYGRFTDMLREDVIAYLHGRGFAVQAFDNETTDELRNAAYLDELEERGNQ